MPTSTPIGYSRSVKLAAGSYLLGMWSSGTAVPGVEALRSSISKIGEPFTIDSITDRPHVGVVLSGEISELDAQVAFAEANAGKAAAVQVLTGFESIVAIEQVGDAASQAIIAAGDAVATNAGALFTAAKYAPWIIGGVLLLAVLVVVYLLAAKVKK